MGDEEEYSQLDVTERSEPIVVNKEIERKGRIKWPTSAQRSEWKSFVEDVDATLNELLVGGVDRKVEVMAKTIFNIGCVRFGLIERGEDKRPPPSRRIDENRK